jgi:3-hydroxyisobutyrate dehydrogenase-like beta-hydroxyacid dehydrogenase
MKPAVGVIGLGIMGSAMARHLIRAKYRVFGYDVLAARRLGHRRAGGRAARSAEDVAGEADIVLCSLPSADALLDTAARIAAAPSPRRQVVVETSTLPIAVKEQARKMLSAAGVVLLDAPLSGTGAQARTRDIVVYASGDRTGYRRAVPILACISRAHHYLGPFGAGSRMKFVANLLVAIHNVAAAEALALGVKAGLDPATMVKVIGDGAGSSRMFQVRAPLMARRRYTPASMKLGVWQKDMTIIADFARELGCATPLFAATSTIYTAAASRGAQRDTAAVFEVLKERSKGKARHHR